MKKIFIAILCYCLPGKLLAQSKIQPILEGGKALVELIKVIKAPRSKGAETMDREFTQPGKQLDDSCFVKKRADLCYRNGSYLSLIISLYRRNDQGYDQNPFTMKVLTQKQECWYQLKAGIYKYRIETDNEGFRTLMAEGELKLEACENMIREITE